MNGILAVKNSIISLISEAVAQAQQTGKLPAVSVPAILIEHPQNQQHGDYASGLPLKMARATGMRPIDIAGIIAGFIPAIPEIKSVTVAPPGFLNFTLSDAWITEQVEAVIASGECYGNIDHGKGKKVQIEYVSANPTGPIHVGHGRGAVLGSSLALELKAAGFDVQQEYYVNDAGNQVMSFKRSLYTRYLQQLGIDAEMPAEGYFGHYMIDLARDILQEEGDRFHEMPADDAIEQLGIVGLRKMLDLIRTDLNRLGVTFDRWFSEQSLYDSGEFAGVLEMLKKAGYVAEKEGAVWFTSTALGESKDNVIIRTDGTPTYFASDIAYHYDKFVRRGFDLGINIWGADHQGHVSRMKAVLQALGIDPARLHVIISQLVTLRRGEELVRLSKRTGEIITLSEVLDEVGSDACRFNFLGRSADSQMDFDLELAKKQSSENPVYYVQYAHARICSIIGLARDREIDYTDGDVTKLVEPAELELLRKMLLLPEVIAQVADTFEPHHLAYYAQVLANAFHLFYKDCRVVSADLCLSKARLKLAVAARTVLARTLHLMGMSAPECM
ncbi:arginyl-tRNA synthetase [Dehalogenimonas formicexedens]|uniref:Arginine--tRNA ligase n=1 Tax=Dehalogenimonas formicexedens TaxID=1839801 RepID=A0A1P8F647_9CHLR|nr:arginine--tRNA ligase [Dehalogenimonas formicexedens]APV43943.1 arginyl-tRNA synthetase [Dehalogenimonas formicexedens]